MTSLSPHLTVIIPAKNAAAWIAEAITSIRTCTDGSVSTRIIVVDDHSADDTADVAGTHAGVTVLSSNGTGIGAALNTALAVVDTPLVGFCDADDRWIPHDVGRRVSLLLDGGGDASVGMMRTFDVEGTIGDTVVGWIRGALIARHDLVRRAGDFSEDQRLGEFIEWWARAADLDPSIDIHQQLAYERRLHGSSTVATNIANYSEYATTVRGILQRRRTAG